jgi:hypothetical protein
MCPEDFSDTADLETAATQSLNLDTGLSDILLELQTLNVHQANIESATLSVDLPLRYRSGQPLYLQDWGDGAGHAIAWTAGTGAASARDTTKFYTKGASWKLTAGSDGGRAATLDIYQGMYPNSKVSFEWAMTWATDIEYFRFSVIWVDGSNYYYVEVYIDVAADEIQIYDDTPGYNMIRTPIDLYADDDCYHFFKVTVDFTTGKYIEAYIDEDTIDLSAYTMLYDAASAGDPLDLEWKLRSDAGKNPTIYVDTIAMVLED